MRTCEIRNGEIVERLYETVMPFAVRLTDDEQIRALEAAKAKMVARADTPHKWNRNPRDYTLQVELDAFGAEIAVARFLRRKWRFRNVTDHDGDGGMAGIQVRQTRYRDGHLLLHPEDKDDHRFFLVVGTMPEFSIQGTILGCDGKRIGKWAELVLNRPAFCVDQSQLEKRLNRP